PSLAFLSSSPRSYLAPHSFPTRRSSDLIHNIGLRLALHRAQVSVVPNLQQFIASGRTQCHGGQALLCPLLHMAGEPGGITGRGRDRKSTRLNSSHVSISYAVFCLKKKYQ